MSTSFKNSDIVTSEIHNCIFFKKKKVSERLIYAILNSCCAYIGGEGVGGGIGKLIPDKFLRYLGAGFFLDKSK